MFIVGTSFVFAAVIDRTEYIEDKLLIVPSFATSTSWSNVNEVLVNDVSEDSLYDDFSNKNSARLQMTALFEQESFNSLDEDNFDIDDQSSGVSSNNESESENDVSEDERDAEIIEETIETETEVEQTEVTDSEPEIQPETEDSVGEVEENLEEVLDDEIEDVDSENEASEEPISFSVPAYKISPFKYIIGTFAFMQQATTVPVTTDVSEALTSESEEGNNNEEIIEPLIEEEIVEQETQVSTSSFDTTSAVAEENEYEESEIDSNNDIESEQDINFDEEILFSTTTDDVIDDVIDDVVTSTDEYVEEEIIDNSSIFSNLNFASSSAPCREEDGCQKHHLIISDFSVPTLENNNKLTDLQLRLSLAAQPKYEEVDSVQRIIISYRYGSDANWSTAVEFDSTEEISNSMNNGYQLVSLPTPRQMSQLESLEIRITYEGDPRDAHNIYVDAVWLEAFAGRFFEPEYDVESTDEIGYQRELDMPKLNDLRFANDDFTANELPFFNLKYNSQQGLIERTFESWFVNKRQFEIQKVELVHPSGKRISMDYDINYRDKGEWSLEFLRYPQQIQPGKYKLEISINEDDELYVDSFEFYWGVLAVNTTKSMYLENEDVDFHLAALTDSGDTICDADLQLQVITPSSEIHDISVEQSGYCGDNNVTDEPDYIADFADTDEIGTYQILLQHFNKAGKVVHKSRDRFEVREFVPYEIERTAPTRIYPPAPYRVSLNIKANRSYEGDIIERVPAGFIIDDYGEATLATYPSHTEIIWHNVVLEEGDELKLSYKFDAPDISPYMFLLGPLNMDGFKEIRRWQIASDALGAIATLYGNQTTNGTELNDTTVAPMVWATSTFDSYYFNHSTSTDSTKLFIQRDGDYAFSVSLPLLRTDTDSGRARWGAEIRINGVVYETGYARSGYVRGQNNQFESSSNGYFFIPDMQKDDEVEIYVELLTTLDTGITAEISGSAQLLAEYISPGENVFAATSTQPIGTTTLNQITANEMVWIEQRQDSGFLHSNTISPEDITIVNPGEYFVTINIPVTTPETTNTRHNILGRVLLDGVEVPGGQFSQGYLRGPDQSSDGDASMHWSGVIISTTTSQVLSISVEREADSGQVYVTPGTSASIYIQELPSSDVIMVTGTQLVTNSDEWNPAVSSSIEWEGRSIYDATAYDHSTTSNPNEVEILVAGDYFISFNAAFTNGDSRNNPIAKIYIDGVPVEGVEVKHGYQRDAEGHEDSSLSFTYLLENVSANSVLTVYMEREGNTGAVDDATEAMLMLWKKAELDLRPDTFTFFDTPFDNIRFASTTPIFEFQTDDPDGVSDIQYQFSISTSSSFTSSTTRTSGVDSGFSNLDTPVDTSPFTEGEQIRFALQSADSLLDNTTYYWRVRAKDTDGSDQWGSWSASQSLTVDSGASTPFWFQTLDGQFESNTLVTARSSGNDSAEVDVVANRDILAVYAEGTLSTPHYTIWDGTIWSYEQDALNTNSSIEWLETEAATTRDEYTLVTQGTDGHVNAQIYNATTSSWGNILELTTTSASTSIRGIDVAYESLSGNAMVVTCSGGADPVYAYWDGSSWSSVDTINVTASDQCQHIRLAADPTSNEIILVQRGVTGNFEALVWNGTSWGDAVLVGVAPSGNTNNWHALNSTVVYEESGDQALVVTADGNDNEFVYTTWDGDEWSTVLNVPHDADYETGVLKADEGSDQVALCMIDSASDAQVILWDGSAWGSFNELTATANTWLGRAIDCEWETLAGRDGYLMVAYSDTGVDGDYHQVWNGSTWSGEQAGSNINDSYYVQTERAGDGTIVAFHFMDEGADELYNTDWNGSEWSDYGTIETDPAQINTNPRQETFSLSAKRYQSAVGVVTTAPIDFTDVPDQPTWGDLSFNATEPSGASVRVRLLYSDAGTCDAYIPNGVLSGNTAGFLASTTPIDLSGLSTTTYDQICLEATINLSGSQSGQLEDWTLTWERTPKLEQYAYRWYDNISNFTPVDPWPVGGNDLSENQAISSEYAINDGEELRLRMSLKNSNIALGTSTNSFALQYSANNSCSMATDWYDVGELGSTTALWRGYANAIVGSDWYSGSWNRRIKITIDSSNVDDDLTDFPVFVDLADLPNSFFNNVQNDGDDIRITEDDGLTELPFELVEINTGTKSGELYFKPDLISSTTDSSFFIYYDNSGASGYSAGHTYGSDNVWDSNYQAVYHFSDTPTGSFGDITNSADSSGSNDATFGGTITGGTVAAGVAGSGYDFNNSNNSITTPDFVGGATDFTISYWIEDPTYNDDRVINGGGAYSVLIWPDNDNGLDCLVNSTSNRANNGGGGNGDNLTGWVLHTCTYDSTTIRNYANGDPSGTDTYTGAVSDPGSTNVIGSDGSRWMEEVLDEVRFSNIARSAEWISTEYNNLINPTGFYDVSSEELVSDGRQIPSTLLTDSTKAETYEEENDAGPNYNGLQVDDIAEWDWVIENNGAAAGTNYCFRMVRDDRSILDTYTQYPQLITNGPPDAPTLSAPFDNEQFASSTPWFEFSAVDDVGDEVDYQIQVDDDYNFSDPVIIDKNSVTNFLQFESLSDSGDKSPFDSGSLIRFTPITALSDNTTYYWRVRAQDPNASGVYGEWSTPYSFRRDSGTTITTWHQRTEEQFATDDHVDTEPNAADDVRLVSGATNGTTTSSAIDFDDVDVGNAWGQFSFNNTLGGQNITYHIEYQVSGNNWDLIPNEALPGNIAGYTSSPVNLVTLDTDTYNKIRLVAVFSGSGSNPQLDDWTVTWGQRVEQPTHENPFDNAKVATTSPTLLFVTFDPESDDLQYELQISTSSSFAASSTFVSGVDAGFRNTASSTDTSPFISGDTIAYDIQSTLTSSSTYWWRVRARDPLGDNVYSRWSDPESFTIDESITVSTWYQTTGDQFDTDSLLDIETSTSSAKITSIVREAMVAYGELGSLAPRYRKWNGSAWGDEGTAASIGALVEWASLEANPIRDEYALGTFDDANDFNFQIYNGVNSTWGNLFETGVEYDYIENSRGFDLAYEQISGDLIAVNCVGSDAVYAVWNGTTWSATTSISLANANDCYGVELVADPTSDEIILGVRHDNPDTYDFEFMVWNGSAWGNATTVGSLAEEDSFGMAIEYEESGDEALVAVSNGGASNFISIVWNGSSWGSYELVTLGDDFEWGMFARDEGSDNLALCYVDNDQDLGIIEWNGSSWGSFTETTDIGETKDGLPISCQYMTDDANDGDVLLVYSDTNNPRVVGEGGKYNIYSSGVLTGESDLDDVEDAFNVQTTRTADDLILAVFLDHNNGDRYDFTYWNGSSWAAHDAGAYISDIPSVVGNPFTPSLDMAARIYPNFTSGRIRSTLIDYDDGTGPRWESFSFTDSTPVDSYITYRVYYETPSATVLVPDLYLPGNSTGNLTSPIDLSQLDKSIHNELTLEADFTCVDGNCPVLYDWMVEWSEGITVSGMAYEYDEVTPLTGGTVSVVVNGVLQAGKTGTIAGDGSWEINNVTTFEDDTIVVFIDGAVADANEAIAATEYDGNGDVTGMVLAERHLTIGSNDESVVVTNAGLDDYDYTDNENVFYSVSVSDEFDLCGDSGCEDAELRVLAGATYKPGANSIVHDIENNGTLDLDATTLRVSGSWVDKATTSVDTSTVIFTATTSAESLSGTPTLSFYNVTFGETSGDASFNLLEPTINVGNILRVNYGSFNRATHTINVAGNLIIGAGGEFAGIGTTTFNGSGNRSWTDSSATSTNIGHVVVDGTFKTVNISSNVRAQSITIGSNDTLRGGTGNTLYVAENFVNNNSFVADSSNVNFYSTSTAFITNSSAFYNLTFSGVDGIYSFTNSSVNINNNLLIATGTVTLPTGLTTVRGSFSSASGTFAHNNGEVRFTSNSAGKTITSNASTFFNAFYDISFTGTGSWTFTDNATTTNNFTVSNGSITFPSGTMTIGRDFAFNGGSFNANGGEIIFLIQGPDSIDTNGSSFNDVRFRGATAGSWYASSWDYREAITIDSTEVDSDLNDFPVYVDLSNLSANFFNNVKSDGGDIRITESDGVTELAREVVNIDTGADTGELYFNASNISSSADTTFYIYYGNSGASEPAAASTYGSENTWNSDYIAVFHMEELNAIDSTSYNHDLTAVGDTPALTASGYIGSAISITDNGGSDYLNFGDNLGELTGLSQMAVSAWVYIDDDSDDDSFFTRPGSSAPILLWDNISGSTNNDTYTFNVDNTGVAANRVDAAPNGISVGDTWQYVVGVMNGSNRYIYVDGSLANSNSGGSATIPSNTGGAQIGYWSGSTGFDYQGEIDEWRLSKVARSTDWISAEHTNMSSSTDFYSVGAYELDSSRSFDETNVDINGDVVIESGASITLPSGNLTVGGSFDNDGVFNANSGTVDFDSIAGSETIAAGNSTFATLNFDSVTGDWDVTEHATASVAININDVGDWNLNSGIVLESTGTFSNTVGGASTTWDGVLRLSSDTDYVINSKTDQGDQYSTIVTVGDTDMSMWNSSSTVYATNDSSSIYSMDHNGNSGDLYIFGNYERSSGTEYWSYATDFDGTDLTGGGERQVDVRIENGGVVEISTSTIIINGISTASTTIDAQSGSYTFTASKATVTANYFEMTGSDVNGMNLTNSSVVTSLNNALFSIGPAVAAISVDASTVDANPASQFFNTNFVTAGGSANVTLNGVPTSYWWFRNGQGDRYGEAFDNLDGDPGSIRWDDSSYNIVISGQVFSDDGSTTLGGPTCDGTTNNVRVVVDGGTYASTTYCSGIDGSYSFNAVSYIGDPVIMIYLDTNGGEVGSVITKTPTADITNLNIYADRVMTRNEDTSPLSIADMAVYDSSDDSDLRYTAATSTTDTLVVAADTELIIASSSTFAPAGNITLLSSGSGETFDGSFHIDDGATFVGANGQSHIIGGNFFRDTGGIFTGASSSITFTATTTGKTIDSDDAGVVNFQQIDFTGVGGAWNINANIAVVGNMTIATGTVTGTGDITMTGGTLGGNGLLSMGGGTVTIGTSTELGGVQGWTFNNLTLGDGVVTNTTTRSNDATTTVSGVLTITSGHFLDAGNSAWDLSGSGTPFVENGTFLEGTSSFTYSGGGATNITSTNYYTLRLAALAGSPTYTFSSVGFRINNDLIVGDANTTVTINTNDPAILVEGDIIINQFGTLIGSDSSALTLNGNWNNNGTFVGSNGLVRFTSLDAFNIAAGSSSFSDVDIIGSGLATISENATSTGTFTLATSSDVVVQSGVVLAVGGQFINDSGGLNTTWFGSTLRLFGGGNYEISDKNVSDRYDNLVVSAGTDIRSWNSSATTTIVENNSSWYSMDHAGVNGELYIYGDYEASSGNDYWSYATDFDGTDLTSGSNERQVEVYIESNGSVTYSGAGIEIVGTSTATTTISVQTTGDYSFDVSAGTFNARYYQFSDLDSDGLTFTNSPDITSLAYGDWILDTNGDAALTVDGSVLDNNPGSNIIHNRFATTSGVTTAVNVRTNGSSVSSWRYNLHTGDVDGEDFDDDTGDPGYIVWDNSTTTYTIGGTVYQNDTSSPSTACGATANIVLVVNNIQLASTTCNGSGVYQFEDINFDSNDVITVYINDEAENAVTVTKEPISSISNMNLYEDHVIVRHENTNPINIADMSDWDSSDDGDIIFTAIDAGTDTLTLPANTKLIVWDNKDFAPNGNVTISGGGAGAPHDGSLELQDDANFIAAGTQSHSIGGSMILGTDAGLTSALSTFTFTTNDAGRTIDVNENAFNNLIFNGSGDWTISDNTLTTNGDLTITSGTLTLPPATTTIGGSFVNGDTFVANGGLLYFTSSDAGETVTFGGSDAATVVFNGSGDWTFGDTNATSTGSTTIMSGDVTMVSGNYAVGGDFINLDTLDANDGTLIFTDNTGTSTITLNGQDAGSIIVRGSGAVEMTDISSTLTGDLIIEAGSIRLSTSTISIAGSLDATGGIMALDQNTVLFNSGDTGETVNPGNNEFYNVQFANAAGGWTLYTATTTNNFSLVSANSFTMASGEVLSVNGVFSNIVGGVKTNWTGSTLKLLSGTEYEINTKSAGGDVYNNLVIGPSTDIRSWDSSAVTTNIDVSSSLYSQDHAGVAGDLYIYGDFRIATRTEYWSYATNFDGTALGGGSRAVNVYIDTEAPTTTTVTLENSGSLRIIGQAGATTTIQNASSTLTYPINISGGTFNANYYSFTHMDANGLNISGTPVITNLSNGDYEMSAFFGNLITLATSSLLANPSKTFTKVRFNSGLGGKNVSLAATTTTAWNFTGLIGNIAGEDYDVDGSDACGSIRWDDSDCQLLQQTHYRWRNDDGGEGAYTAEWYHPAWDKRKRVRLLNNDATAYATTAVKITVAHETDDMQANFYDLRFTDSDGTTLIPHWIENFSGGTEAQIWIETPNMPASGQKDLFMYYDNPSVPTTTSSLTEVFAFADDFEDGNISEYSGNTSLFTVDGSFAYGGSYGLDTTGYENNRAADGIYRTDVTVSQGQIIRYMQYVNTAYTSDEVCTMFGIQSPGSANNNYAVCLEQLGTDRITLAQDVQSTDNYPIGDPPDILGQTNVTYSTGWYEVVIDWQTDDTIDVELYNNSGTLVATTSASSNTYTSGGVGFTYWGQHGGWDSYVAYNRVETTPTVRFGAEQTDGGATWAAGLNQAGTGFDLGEVARLRVAVENTGLDRVDQEFQLAFAPKGTAPSCASVNPASFTAVPNQSSCTGSGICMATSSNFSNGDPTTDRLASTSGAFTAGEMVEDSNNKTGLLDVNQNQYTELEYAVTVTVDATDDAYCFLVTDNGSLLDSYVQVPELSLQFVPTLGTVYLNNSDDISLTPGTTTAVYATGTVTDLNGYADLSTATATIYRSGVAGGASCTADNNNCYIAAGSGQCNFVSCSGNSCTVECLADIFFHADPTDVAPYEGEEWTAFIEVEDSAGNYGFGGAISGVELFTMRAIDIDNDINYGAVAVEGDTGNNNASTTIYNEGNIAIDIEVQATDLLDGYTSSRIPGEKQKFSTTTFDYGTCSGSCVDASTTVAVGLEVELSKPTTETPPVEDKVFWGISVPYGVNSAPHTGINIFTPVDD